MHRHFSISGLAILLASATATFLSGSATAQVEGLQVYEPPAPAFQNQLPDQSVLQPAIVQPEIVPSNQIAPSNPQFGQPQLLPPIIQSESAQPELIQPQFIGPQYIEQQHIEPQLAEPGFIVPEFTQPGIVLPEVSLPELFEQPVIAQPNRTLRPGKPKKLAPGVLKEIPIDLNPRDMFSIQRPLPGLKANPFTPKSIPKQQTLYGQSRRVMLLRDNVWQYEFAFTGLRQANLKMPLADGSLVERNVWYMVYRIRDTGKTMTFEQVKLKPEFEHIKNELRRDRPIAADSKKFLPRFSLEGWVASDEFRRTRKDRYRKVTYRDEIAPAVLAQIRRREDRNQRLLDGHQMSQAKIPVANNNSDPGLWGVAIWTDVDPRIDYVSVYVKGLTNAYRLGSDFDDPTRKKTLQLNFWRPGDLVRENDDEVDFGIPLVDNPTEQATICRRYDLPGPLLRGYHVNEVAKRNVLVMEADADVSLVDFQSRLTPTLDQGKLPKQIGQAFARSGINLNPGTPLTTIIEGKRWSFEEGENQYILALEPQFWESDFGSIRFIKSLDHIWIYR